MMMRRTQFQLSIIVYTETKRERGEEKRDGREKVGREMESNREQEQRRQGCTFE